MCSIEKRLGRGAFSVVYLLHIKNHNKFALKVAQLNARKDSISNPEAEAKILKKLCHPHLTQCVAHFLENNTLYLLTEYCMHGSLKSYVTRRCEQENSEPINEIHVLKWTSQMADALRYLHAKKIIHRDLKTDNVFLNGGSNVKIGDLGIARELDVTNETVKTFAGTFPYMSPEMLDGERYTSKADMWSLGCCVHEMMTLQQTFPSTFLALAEKLSQGEIPPMPDTYGADLQKIVLRLLRKDPSQRPDALEVLYCISKITKTKFSPGAHHPLPGLDVSTDLKEKIILKVEQFESSNTQQGVSSRHRHDSSSPDSDIDTNDGETGVETVRMRNSRRKKQATKPIDMMSQVQEIDTIDPTQLAEEAGEWLRQHSQCEPGAGTIAPQSRHSLETSVTLYTRAQCVKFQQMKKESATGSEEDLPPEVREVVRHIVQLYQHEDRNLLEMMLVSAMGSRNFTLHGDAVIQNVLSAE